MVEVKLLKVGPLNLDLSNERYKNYVMMLDSSQKNYVMML